MTPKKELKYKAYPVTQQYSLKLWADKTGSYQQEVCSLRGIVLERLPTACLELDPVEQFFEELRKSLAGHRTDRSVRLLSLHAYYLIQIRIIDRHG